MARPVHVMAVVLYAGCVVPPPLSVEKDGGVNAPPSIVDVLDPTGTSRRPPETITLAQGATQELTVTMKEIDDADDLFVQIFVDYDIDVHDATVNCGAPADQTSTRVAHCTTALLCGSTPAEIGGHLLEIEAYDREPDPNAPYRTTTGYWSTWTFHLECTAPS